MDVSPVLVADLQAPEAVEPGERPFDHPAVASQAVLGLDTTAGDAPSAGGRSILSEGPLRELACRGQRRGYLGPCYAPIVSQGVLSSSRWRSSMSRARSAARLTAIVTKMTTSVIMMA